MFKNKILAFVAMTMGIAMSSAAQQIPAPSGWSDKAEGSQRIVQKGNTRIAVGPWESLQGKSIGQWLEARKSTVRDGVQFVSVGKVKEEKGGSTNYFYATQRIKINGKTGSGSLLACPGNEGAVRLLRLEASLSSFADALTGGKWLEKVCKEEPKGSPGAVSTKPSQRVASTKPRSSSEPRTSNTSRASTGASAKTGALPAVRKLSGLKEVRGVIVYGIQAGGMFGTTEDFIALFDDGSYSSDLPRTFGVSKAASRKKRPRYWGEWRMRGGELELKDSDDKAFDTTSGDWVAIGGGRDHRLNGCYGRLTSSSGGDYTSGTTVGLARSWCFYPDGRFTNKSSAFGNSSNVTMGVSDKARGRYRIDGNMARFVYDDGHEVIAAFGYINKDRTHIMLNGKRFMGRKK